MFDKSKFYHYAFTYQTDSIDKAIYLPITLINGERRVDAVALWDTGADLPVIDHRLVDILNCTNPIDASMIDAGGHVTQTQAYNIDVQVPSDCIIPSVQFLVADYNRKRYRAIIGMNVMRHEDMAISFHDGKTTLSFRSPSQGIIDFTKDE